MMEKDDTRRGNIRQCRQGGFTLIELMISMSMGLIILLGMMMMFTSDAKVASTLASRTERLGDVYLASQIMQGELRNSKDICLDPSPASPVVVRLIYQPGDSTTSLPTGCDSVDATHGAFLFKKSNSTHPSPYICWDRPDDDSGCQEMIRDLIYDQPNSLFGLSVPAPVNNIWTVTLKSKYKNTNRDDRTMDMKFKVWPRNQ